MKLVIIAFTATLAFASFDCRPPGAIVPRPTNIESHPALVSATAKLANSLRQATSGEIDAGWVVENTSFSIGFVSRYQPNKTVPAWEYHHLASNTVNGTKELTRNSQYLIGSVTKVISDYILLKSGLPLDDPVTKYIPKLRGPSRIDWDSITLRQLGSGLSGVTQFYGSFQSYLDAPYYESLGFPRLNDADYPTCGIAGLNKFCNEEEFFEAMMTIPPVSKPEDRPEYSTISFFIFIKAIQEATGKNYTQLLQSLVTEPLEMSSTLESPGNDSRAVIPPIENGWGIFYDYFVQGAGLVSTLSDLSIFFHSILDRSILETETETLNWLKPNAATGSPYALVGMPWEIYRTQNLTPKHPHTIDLYAKGGAAAGYRSQVAVIDEYGLAIIALTAGSPKAANFIYNAVLATLVPAVDEIARDQARKYTGAFSDRWSKPEICFNVKITQDENSMVLSGIEKEGKDILASYREIFAAKIGRTLDMKPVAARIYPLDILSNSTIAKVNGTTERVIREEWRIEWDLRGSNSTELPGANVSEHDCQFWVAGEWAYYGEESLERVVFVADAVSREILGIEIPILKTGLLGK